MNKIIIAIFTALGLTPPKDDATDEQITASAKELLGKLSAGAAEVVGSQLSAFSARLDGIAANAGKDAGATIQTFSSQLSALVSRLDVADREALLMQASYEGKVVPKSVLPDDKGVGGLPIATLKTFIAELPVTVPLEARTKVGLKTFTPSHETASPLRDQIRGMLGITKEDAEKYGKAA